MQTGPQIVKFCRFSTDFEKVKNYIDFKKIDLNKLLKNVKINK